MRFYEEIYLDRDNSIQRTFTVDGANLDITDLTRATFEIEISATESVVLDSDEYEAISGIEQPFDWTTFGEDGTLILNFSGMLLSGGIDMPEGLYRAKYVIYGPDYPAGLDGWGWVYVKIIPKSNG